MNDCAGDDLSPTPRRAAPDGSARRNRTGLGPRHSNRESACATNRKSEKRTEDSEVLQHLYHLLLPLCGVCDVRGMENDRCRDEEDYQSERRQANLVSEQQRKPASDLERDSA